MIGWMAAHLGRYYYNKNKSLDLVTWINGFKVLLLYIFTISFLIAFGLYTKLWDVLIINLIALSVLRMLIEGRHFSIDKCFLITNGLIVLSSLFSQEILNNIVIVVMIVLQLLLLIKHLRQKNNIIRIIAYLVFIFIIIFIFNQAFILAAFILGDHLTVSSKK